MITEGGADLPRQSRSSSDNGMSLARQSSPMYAVFHFPPRKSFGDSGGIVSMVCPRMLCSSTRRRLSVAVVFAAGAAEAWWWCFLAVVGGDHSLTLATLPGALSGAAVAWPAWWCLCRRPAEAPSKWLECDLRS